MTNELELSEVFQAEWSWVVAALVRQFRDLDVAEDAAQEAFEAAAARWPIDGRPQSPRGWLLTTARRRAIDRLRRQERFDERIPDLIRVVEESPAQRSHGLVDDRLALILGCCHPALAPDSQVALTLRAVAGLSTAQIARAFLVSESTMTRRITRAKRKIEGANITFRADRYRLVERLPVVCSVIYSIYTEGHTSATDASLVRGDLCEEALWLAGLLAELVPDDGEVRGLFALLLLTDARRSSRTDANGSLVLLVHQRRADWDRNKIAQGLAELAQAHGCGQRGPHQFQAAIAALHATADSFETTDWQRIISLYDVLMADHDDAVMSLNRAAAVGHFAGPQAGIDALDELSPQHVEQLDHYAYMHACRGEFEARLGHRRSAQRSLRRALQLTRNGAEREQLSERIDALDSRSNPGR